MYENGQKLSIIAIDYTTKKKGHEKTFTFSRNLN